ncbi:MAG TPA: DUF2177 family protein [Myxococcota bacterium]|nr:DUF2177 family protein [Myxococcota bacterium]
MTSFLVSYFSGLLLMLIIDGVWLYLMIPRIYQKHLAHLLAPSVNVWVAFALYVLYAFGIYFLIVRQAAAQNMSLTATFGLGLVLGLTAYGCYDLTNQATLKEWPTLVTVIDMIWGGLLTGFVAIGSTWITRLFHRI